jgi:hypothetical protein
MADNTMRAKGDVMSTRTEFDWLPDAKIGREDVRERRFPSAAATVL